MKLRNLVDFEYDLVQGDLDVEVGELVYNTKAVTQDSVFVAVRGARFDAHDVLHEIASNGAKAIVIEHDCDLPKDVTVIRVESARKALACMAANYFDKPIAKMISIAITGTKGKTTTTHMVKTILEAGGKKVGIIGTNGIVIGNQRIPSLNTTPESFELHRIFSEMVKQGCDVVVMEASSQGVKMFRTFGIVFDYGIFTNISPDHIGPNEHESMEEYLQCKADLFLQCKTMLLNADDAASSFISENVKKHSKYVQTHSMHEQTNAKINRDNSEDKQTHSEQEQTYLKLTKSSEQVILTYGTKQDCDYRFRDVAFHSDAEYMGIQFQVNGKCECVVDAAIPGHFNAYNALAAVAVCDLLGIDAAILSVALRKIHVDGRMEIAYSSKDFTVIVDYAHNAISMEKLLDTLRDYRPKRLVIVFGCGGNRSKDRRYSMGEIAGKKADLSILTADNSRFEKVEDIIADIKEYLIPTGGAYLEIPDRREAIFYAISHAQPGDLIAIIGKGHEDYQEIAGVRTHFLDREVVQEAMESLR